MAVARTQVPQSPAPAPAAPARRAPRALVSSATAGRVIDSTPAVRLAPSPAERTAGLPPKVAAVVNAPGPGEQLPAGVRGALERAYDYNLEDVRVHSGPEAAAAAVALNARAFTYGMHIFLASGERATDLRLMGHEVAHVVQQQGMPVFQMYSAGATERFEAEANQAASAAGRGETATINERTGDRRVQRVGLLEQGEAWVRDQVMSRLEQHAPELAAILRQGVVEWLKERIGAALQSLFDELSAPVRAVRGVVATIGTHFANLVSWMRDAAVRISRGDCGAISEAAQKIQDVFEGLAAPVVDRVKQIANSVKTFFTGLWDRFGAPVWNLLQRIGGAIWEQIQRASRWVWEKTQPIRDFLSRAWRWFKNWLGIGEGEEGQNGVLQWFQRKAGEAWTWISARLEPFKRPLMVVSGILVMLSPAGPIIAIGAATVGIVRGIRWIRQHLGSGDGVVQQRGLLQGTILPAITNTVNTVSNTLLSVARTIVGHLNNIMGGLGEMAGAVAASILRFAVGIVQFIAQMFRQLVEWATNGVQTLATLVQTGLQRLREFAQKVIDVLGAIARTIGNLMQLPMLLAGRLWNAVPACIRDPFVNFFIPLILRQISFFRELVATPEAWARTRNEIMQLIHQVFRNFDLMGAIRTAFGLLVRALRIPVDLAVQVLRKAAQAWDAVLARPIEFIKNAARAMGMGFVLFFRNILSHLAFGIQGWLFNQVQEMNITPPATWDLRGVFGLVLQVLGITLERVFTLLETRIGRPAVQRIRAAINFLSGAWEWVKIAIQEGAAGLWRVLVDRLRDLGRVVIESAVGWVMTRIIAIVSARLTALAASAGLSGILEALVAVYQAIQTAIEYARRILEILNTVFDTILQLTQGVLGPAAEGIQRGLRLAMPIVIGFLANYVGLGGVGTKIREIITSVRERVDNAILSLIDGALRVGRAFLDLLQRGIAFVTEWWKSRKPFRTSNGADHTLLFQGEARTATLHVRSVDTPLSRYLGRLRETGVVIPQRITDIQEEIYSLRVRFVAHSTGGEVQERRAHPSGATGPRISELLNELGEELKKLPDPDRPGQNLVMPVSNLVKKESKNTTAADAGLGQDSSDGMVIEATALSIRPGSLVGSQATYRSELFKAVDRRSGTYSRGHLLGAHLYGPGNADGGRWNLIPITESANRGMTNVENRIHSLIFTQNKVVSLKITATYPQSPAVNPAHPIKAEHYLPHTISYELKTLKPKPTTSQDPAYRENIANWEPDTPIDIAPISSNPPFTTPLSTNTLNVSTRELIVERAGVPAPFAQALVNYINEVGHFGTKETFITAMGSAAGTIHRGEWYPTQANINTHTATIASQLNDDLTWKS